MKYVLLVRHAESSLNYNLKDFDRPLNEDGIKDAGLMSEQLMSKNIIPDLIISSGANRALETSKIISSVVQYSHGNIEINNNIYHSTCDDVINIISEVPNGCNQLMITGHNPTIHFLSQTLTNEQVHKFPTCSMFYIEFNNKEWCDIRKGKKQFMIYPSLYK